jgi:transcriptional regulator with GAF, ATPase, and Fis domain
VAATNRDLEREVGEGRFRQDLFYRLNVFPLKLPPLRERKEDIPALATAAAQRFARQMGRTVSPLPPESIRRLQSYAWPGNVRELHNVIERAVITAVGDRLNLDRALPDVAPDVARPAAAEDTRRIHTLQELESLERENLRRALESTGWRISGEGGAAALLGMNPSTLRSRMKSLGVKAPA